MSDASAIPASPVGLPPATAAVPPKIAAQAREFEAVFLGQMVQLMLGSVERDAQITGGNGEDAFRGMLAEKIGGAIAQRGGIGLAPVVAAKIIQLQEGQP